MTNMIKNFFKNPISGGIILLIVTAIAIVLDNGTFRDSYNNIVHYVFFNWEGHNVNMNFIANDILMPIFFLVVGLEIKREFLGGELAGEGRMLLPVVGAIGGVIVPSLIYYILNKGGMIGGVNNARGWAIPSATDIAFALGVISLLGSRVPLFLKVFLTALAIIDDLLAIIIIAIFYNDNLSYIYLFISGGVIITLILLNIYKCKNIYIYLFIGIILWYFILHSGVHATISGVILGIIIPFKKNSFHGDRSCILRSLEHRLLPWIRFAILPIFAFINSGISFNLDSEISLFTNNITLGVLLGLFIGKQLGVFTAIRLLYFFKLAHKPEDVNYTQIYGTSILTGIGFTMSIFISELAFGSANLVSNLSKMGIILGSILSAIIGILLLTLGSRRNMDANQAI